MCLIRFCDMILEQRTNNDDRYDAYVYTKLNYCCKKTLSKLIMCYNTCTKYYNHHYELQKFV